MTIGEDRRYSLWHLLPHDVLWLIIERLDFIECHRVLVVCRNWRSCWKTLKNLPMPNDTIPWLMTRKTRKRKPCNSVIKLYRPTTNKTYKIVLPDIKGMVCLYSKDGWLLLYKLNRCKSKWDNLKLCLVNPFSMDKMELPELKREWKILMIKGTFSTHLKCPDCVIVVTEKEKFNITLYAWKKGNDMWKEMEFTVTLYAWKKGNDMWKESLYPISRIWLSDDLLYCFDKYGKGFVFDRDLNIKQKITSWRNINMSFNMTLYKNELFAISTLDTEIPTIYKFDHFSMDWVTDDSVSNMIWFNNRLCDDIGFLVKEECTEAQRSVFFNGLKLRGCQIKASTTKKYYKMRGFGSTVNNTSGYSMFSSIEREPKFSFMEREPREDLFPNDEIIRKEFAPFIVYQRKQGIWNWVNIS